MQIAKEWATEQQLRRVIDSALSRIGERKLTDRTVREQLEAWLGSKRGALAPGSIIGYQQAADLLIGFLGPRADKSTCLLYQARRGRASRQAGERRPNTEYCEQATKEISS